MDKEQRDYQELIYKINNLTRFVNINTNDLVRQSFLIGGILGVFVGISIGIYINL